MIMSYWWKRISPEAKVIYLTDHVVAEKHLSQLHADAANSVLGFDIEWKPNYIRGEAENPVSLIQLANDSIILLIQVSSMSSIPPSLVSILTARNIIKCGVGIQLDIKKVHKDLRISPISSCVDLGLFARSMDNDQWKGRYKDPIGLSRLAFTYYGHELGKGKITRSNWENNPLTEGQMQYAANDAHAGYAIYKALAAKKPPSIPKSRCYSFDLYHGQLYDTSSELPIINSSTAELSSPTPSAPSCWAPADAIDFALVQWMCHNPDYDPGPPPPPKVPKALTNDETRKDVSTKRGQNDDSRNSDTRNSQHRPSRRRTGQAHAGPSSTTPGLQTDHSSAPAVAVKGQNVTTGHRPRVPNSNAPGQQRQRQRPRRQPEPTRVPAAHAKPDDGP